MRACSMSARAAFVAVAAGVLWAGAFCAGEDAPKTGLAALVDSMPQADKEGKDGRFTGPDLETMKKVYDEVLKDIRQNVPALVGMLVEPGKGEDYRARYVLHALVIFVNRPDNDEANRAKVREALLSTLVPATPKGVQKYVLEELKHLGSKTEVAKLSGFLADEELCESAAQALVAIRDTADVFRQALPAAKGKNRVTVIQALGVLRDAKAADDIRKAVTDADSDTRIAACDALANIGDAASVDTLLAAAEAAKENERVKMTEAALRLAARLVEADKKKDAERIYSKLWESRTAREERQVRCAAIQGLVVTRGDIADVLTAIKTNDFQIRSVAIRAAITMLGDDATKKIIEALAKAEPADRAALLAILAARRDPAALAAVLNLIKDADEGVRIAAMQAAAAIGGKEAAEAVAGVIAKAAGKERDAAAEALATMRGEREVNAVAGEAAKQATDPAVRLALLGVLASRRAEDQAAVAMAAFADKDKALRAAALKTLGVIGGGGEAAELVKQLKAAAVKEDMEALETALAGIASRQGDAVANQIAPALEGAPPASAAALVRVLGAAGSGKARDVAAAQAKSTVAEAQDAAVRVLAEWRDKSAASALLEVAQTADNDTHRILAIRGIIRLLDRDMKDPEKLKWLEGVVKAAKRPDEKRQALGKLQDIQTLKSFELAALLLDDEAVKDEAARAIVKIGEKVARNNADSCREALEKAVKAAKDKGVRDGAENILKQIKKQ